MSKFKSFKKLAAISVSLGLAAPAAFATDESSSTDFPRVLRNSTSCVNGNGLQINPQQMAVNLIVVRNFFEENLDRKFTFNNNIVLTGREALIELQNAQETGNINVINLFVEFVFTRLADRIFLNLIIERYLNRFLIENVRRVNISEEEFVKCIKDALPRIKADLIKTKKVVPNN